MKICILSKRIFLLTERLKEYYEKLGHEIKILTKTNLSINDSLLNFDLFILKSKQLVPFIYAGYYAEANKIPVIPNPEISKKHKNRIEAYLLVKETGLEYPKWYYGTKNALKINLKDKDFPLLLKPISSSGSEGVKIIFSIDDIDADDNEIIYLEKFLNGTHYNVYFIENKICTLEKQPLKNEHSKMLKIETPNEISNIINKWKNKYNLLFGHLDLVKENHSNKFFVVDTGSFPEFSNWQCEGDPAKLIGDLILKEYERLKILN